MSSEILIYHTHTEESNRTGNDYVISNHFADYPQLIEELPSDIDPVIVRTEHVMKREREDKKSFHQRPKGSKDRTFSEEIEERGGQVEYHDTHLTGTLGENSFAAIEGIEVSYKRPDSHMTVCGVDVESEIDGWKIGNEELVDLVENSAWVGIPHWNVMNPTIEEKQELFEETDRNDDFEMALNHSGGYGFGDLYINDELSRKSDIEKYADEYDLPVVPEYDWHVALPQKLDHAGVLEKGTIDSLRDGEIPIENILGCDMVNYDISPTKAYSHLVDSYNFLVNHHLPSNHLNDSTVNRVYEEIFGRPISPYTEDHFRQKALDNISRVTDDVDREMIVENTKSTYN